METLEFFAGNIFINLFIFMTSSVGLLVGDTVFKSQHNGLEILYIRRMIVWFYTKKKVIGKR